MVHRRIFINQQNTEKKGPLLLDFIYLIIKIYQDGDFAFSVLQQWYVKSNID